MERRRNKKQAIHCPGIFDEGCRCSTLLNPFLECAGYYRVDVQRYYFHLGLLLLSPVLIQSIRGNGLQGQAYACRIPVRWSIGSAYCLALMQVRRASSNFRKKEEKISRQRAEYLISDSTSLDRSLPLWNPPVGDN